MTASEQETDDLVQGVASGKYEIGAAHHGVRVPAYQGPSMRIQRAADKIIAQWGDGDMDYYEMTLLLTQNGIGKDDADHIARNMGLDPARNSQPPRR
jgi:hypothetical protein